MEELKKTHVLVPEPEMGVRDLADYMAGSDRKKRAVLVSAKYRPRARLLQHREAKAAIATALIKGNANKAFFRERADFIRNKLATDDFDALTNETNADYLEAFADVVESLDLPGVEFLPGKTYAVPPINGLKVPFKTNLMLRRITKTNKVRVGGMMFRYAKDKPLAQLTAEYQSATILGLLRDCAIEEGAELDPNICMTLCGVTSVAHPAPTNAVTRFNNTKAAAATIADAWPNVKPPNGAII